MTSRAERPAPLPLALLACVVAVFGVSAVWGGVAVLAGGQCAWMAVLAALDAVLLLRLAKRPPGHARAGLALAVTAATIVGGNFLVATALIGRAMGMRPVEAVGRMSVELAALHAQANSGWIEAAWYAAALAVAWRGAR